MAPALLADAAAALSAASVDARLTGGAVVAAATLTAAMYTFHIALHTAHSQRENKKRRCRK